MSESPPPVDGVERAEQGERPSIEMPAPAESQEVLPAAMPAEPETSLPPGEIPAPAGEAEPVTSVLPEIASQDEAPESAVSPLPPPSQPGPAPARTTQPAMLTRAQAFWMMAGSSLLAFFLSVIFVLVFLTAVNGGLRYARPAQLIAAQSRLDRLSQQADTLRTSLDEISSRLDTLEGLGPRVGAVEREMEGVRKDIAEAAAQVNDFQSKIDNLSLQVDALLARAGRFQKFLDGLGDLLKTLAEPEVP